MFIRSPLQCARAKVLKAIILIPMGYRRNSVEAPKSLSAFQKKNRPPNYPPGRGGCWRARIQVERMPCAVCFTPLRTSLRYLGRRLQQRRPLRPDHPRANGNTRFEPSISLKSPGLLRFLTGRRIQGAVGFTRTAECLLMNDVLACLVSSRSQKDERTKLIV